MKSFLFILALFPLAAQAEIQNCTMSNGNFVVIDNGTVQRQTVDNFANYQVDCSRTVAALYDGDDLHLYVPGRGFRRELVDDANPNAQLKVRGNLVGFYDGDDLYVYEGDKNRFDRVGVDDNFPNAQLSVSHHMVAFYDGDDLYVYANGAFNRQGVDDAYPEALIVDTQAGILFYDGDDVYANCGGSIFEREPADDNQPARPIQGPGRRPGGIQVGLTQYLLIPGTCKIQKL